MNHSYKRPSDDSRELAREYVGKMLDCLEAAKLPAGRKPAPLPACDEVWWRENRERIAAALEMGAQARSGDRG